MATFACLIVDDNPSTYKENVRSSVNKRWKVAIDEEIKSLT